MNKIPTKQIYLLLIIISGIITLSVYSTYAIFTLESETSDIVNIQTSNFLSISANKYEYKQLVVPKNSYISTDVDIYNNFDYELCYAVWYKVVENNNNVSVYQQGDTLTTNSTIESYESKRITLLIANENSFDIKINIGVLNAKNEGTCNLNGSKDKSLILLTIDNIKMLSDAIIKEDNTKNEISNYLTYKSMKNEILLSNDEKIYIATAYTYQDENFTMTNPDEILATEIKDYISNNSKDYYICLDNKKCNIIYRIISLKEENNTYKITEYDKLVGYLSGESGLRKTNNNDYYYYGDNPNNFIYYNCTNDSDDKTCELWRIIGFIYDNENNTYLPKIIKNDSLGKYKYDDLSNVWNSSSIEKYLNQEYNITKSTIKLYNFMIENVIENSIKLLEEKNNSKVLLMNLSDYLNTSSCQNKKLNEFDESCINQNWLNDNSTLNEWTMTVNYSSQSEDEETEEIIIPKNNTAYNVGSSINETNVEELLNIRPVVYLNANTILIDGDGTIDSPYIIR